MLKITIWRSLAKIS